ncbi:hypothetical protein B296_00010815 [Ensete ventricosum]|uniref:Dirigent protein n=1 Tax=Ensete ventricosum TaxID=4639 RepID=A0A426ZMH5_ENSVE|nr:hypothetical protein B296_00010815 [Ensete ventricosum]
MGCRSASLAVRCDIAGPIAAKQRKNERKQSNGYYVSIYCVSARSSGTLEHSRALRLQGRRPLVPMCRSVGEAGDWGGGRDFAGDLFRRKKGCQGCGNSINARWKISADLVGSVSSGGRLAASADDKFTHLHFYFHEKDSGPNATLVTAVEPPKNSTTSFGSIVVYDNVLRERDDPASALIGRAQGIGAITALDGGSGLAAMNLVFTAGEYNGSTLALLGRFVAGAVSERGIVGGSGRFRLARGYSLSKVVSSTTAAVVAEFDVYGFMSWSEEESPCSLSIFPFPIRNQLRLVPAAPANGGPPFSACCLRSFNARYSPTPQHAVVGSHLTRVRTTQD